MGVGEVLEPQRDLVLAVVAEVAPDAQLLGELEAGAELLVGRLEQVVHLGHADAGLGEPGRLPLRKAVAPVGDRTDLIVVLRTLVVRQKSARHWLR